MISLASISILVLSVSSTAAGADYSLVGHGKCLDAAHHRYEYWYLAAQDAPGLMYRNDDHSTCACPECEEVCSQHTTCLGYDFFCCQEGARCFGGAYVLFSEGTRPSGTPPGKFSTGGPRSGVASTGGDLIGAGPIQFTDYYGPATSCFNKVAAVTQDFAFIGHGVCLDTSHHRYEYWYIGAQDAPGLLYSHGNRDTCGCQECQEVCSQYTSCVGYRFYCCPEGERCFGGGYVLFSKGTRPSGTPPGKFSTGGPRAGIPSSGGDLSGTGMVSSVEYGGPDAWCYGRSITQLSGFAVEAPMMAPNSTESPALRR